MQWYCVYYTIAIIAVIVDVAWFVYQARRRGISLREWFNAPIERPEKPYRFRA